VQQTVDLKETVAALLLSHMDKSDSTPLGAKQEIDVEAVSKDMARSLRELNYVIPSEREFHASMTQEMSLGSISLKTPLMQSTESLQTGNASQSLNISTHHRMMS
jgi:hypothetical protein